MYDRPSLNSFKTNFDFFTGNALRKIDWSNLIAAGGSVLACLMPVPDFYKYDRDVVERVTHPSGEGDDIVSGSGNFEDLCAVHGRRHRLYMRPNSVR